MELLVAQSVTYLAGGRELLAGVNLRLSGGARLGLVGPNGSGKSTLLRLLAGLEAPDAGRLLRAPGVRIGYLPQTSPGSAASGTLWEHASRVLARTNELEARARQATEPEEHARLQAEFERAGGYGAEAALRRELAAVGFGAAHDHRPLHTLSAGERRRLALATTLAEDPDVLLLDEPTNHLDVAARARLGRRLAGWAGALVVVSHDRALLDEATLSTAFLEPGGALGSDPSRLVVEPGAYTEARARRDGALRAGHKRERERAKEAARLEAMAAELATFGRKAAARKRAAERGAARLKLAAAKLPAPAAEPRLARSGVHAHRRHLGATLLEAKALTAPPVLSGVTLKLNRGQRVALLGANASGKSTLLKLLSGELPSSDPGAELRYAPGLKLRYVGQEDRGLSEQPSLLEQVSDRLGGVAAGALLAGAGVPTDRWDQPPAALSGGERARAGLALALAEDADLWLIDEPTNDLDLHAVEALEQQLLEQLTASGAGLVLATHDRRLAERLTDEVWSVETGDVQRYPDVAAYLTGNRLGDDGANARTVHGPAAVVLPADSAHTETREAAANDAASDETTARTLTAQLEERRSQLLRLRDEDPDLSDRDRTRVLQLLGEVEEALMAAYAARLPAPAPSYRSVENGVVVYAERLDTAPEAGSGEPLAPARLAVVAPQPFPTTCLGAKEASEVAASALAQLAAAAGGEAQGGLADPDQVLALCAAAWLEARLEGEVGHLRFVHREAACALPYVLAALANAGTRLAFTRLGAHAVQLHHPGALPGVSLRPAGNGWWSLGLGEFLRAEGWLR